MKLHSRNIEKDRSGSVKLTPENEQDLWHAYNIIHARDRIKAPTFRSVVSETATGSTDKTNVRITLTIQVENIDYDVQGGTLRVSGRNAEENKYVKMGAFHTIELEKHRAFTLYKDEWDIITLDRIEESTNVAKHAEIAAVVLEEGLANLCFITEALTVVKQKIEMSIPRKRKGSTTQFEKGVTRFYDAVVDAIMRHIDFEVTKVVILASPGFTRDTLYNHMFEQAVKKENKVLLANKPKFIRVHCSSGQKHALQEALQDPAVQAQLSETKYSKEIATMEKFYNLLGNDPARAFYGYKHVETAAEANAIETLMVTDGLFRSTDLRVRRKYIELVERVKDTGGKVLVFSTMHVSGEQLTQLSGVAAILHFPMQELDEEELEDDPLEAAEPPGSVVGDD
ncbi:hypothetical protein BJ742DRAFT_128250 [Cladochytrium replicatum]|nr:hypothetical protein BJ742DRAFT_128250 [Cladochytrium replicatum]